MAKLSPLAIAPPLIFAGFVVLAAIGMFRTNKDEIKSVLIGKPAPALTQDGFDAVPKASPELLANGDIKLVNFWASWCPPCRAEHPRLMALKSQGISIIGVNFKDQKADARQFIQTHGNPFSALAFDPKGRSAIDWGVSAPPETFILDANGVVLFRFAGPLVGSDYENRFLPAFEKALQAHKE